MNRSILHSAKDLLGIFFNAHKKEMIGIEIELFNVDPITGKTFPYKDSDRSLVNLINDCIQQGLGEAYFQGEYLMGIILKDGGHIFLEHGGAIEYSSAPSLSLTETVQKSQRILTQIASIAASRNMAVLASGLTPFSTEKEIQWTPKPYGSHMRRYFNDIGQTGGGGVSIMAHSTSVQATIDYLNPEDLIEKVHTASILSPLCVALFANSPIENGKLSGALSRRTQLWTLTDTERCGIIPVTVKSDFSLTELVQWMSTRRMIYFSDNGEYIYANQQRFVDILANGLPNASQPTEVDWLNHIGQLWPDVRVRKTIELRAPDEPPAHALYSVPAFWIGLLYNKDARTKVSELLGHYTYETHKAVREQAAVIGLKACYPDNLSLQNLGKEVVKLARAGLTQYLIVNDEPLTTCEALNPLDDILATGITWAEECINDWQQGLINQPKDFVARYRLPY